MNDHAHDHQRHGAPEPDVEAEQYWEGHYGARDQVWSGRPNALLVDVVSPLPPGRALDLGCGEGGDAVWLADRGWQVTAVDVSPTALDRVAAHARRAGVESRIELQRHDLAHTFPAGTFDLVSAAFLHTPLEFPRARVLRTAAAAVAPGGLLLVVGHGSVPPWGGRSHPHPHPHLPGPEEVLADLELDAGAWRTELLHSPEREAVGPAGETAVISDSVVAVRRLPS